MQHVTCLLLYDVYVPSPTPLPKCLIIFYLPFVFAYVSQMKAVDLAEIRKLLEAKINRCKREIRACTITIEADRILAQIMAYQWVQGRIQDLVIENEGKDTKVMI